MVQPYNYILDIPNPLNSLTDGMWNGFKMGAAIDQTRKQQEQYEAQKQQQTKMSQSLQYLSQNPTPENYASVMTMFPQLADNLRKSYETWDEGKKKSTLSIASQSYAALLNNQPDIAKQVLNEAATAFDNSKKEKEAGVLRGYMKMIDNNPQAARTSIGLMMAATDPDKFKDIYTALGSEQRANEMQPVELAQKQAQTNKTVAETGDIPLAAQDRRQGVMNQGQKIEYDNQFNYDKLSQDQQQFYASLDQKDRLEATRLRAAKAENSIQRVERLEKVENYATASAQAAEASRNAARLANLAGENSGAYWDRLIRQVPGTSENTFAKDIESLKSQVFLAQVEKMRGLGALTDKEGDAIRSSIASLDINQGPEVVKKNLTKIAQQLSLAAQSANRKAQLYATKGQGYSPAVKEAARQLGISEAEAQKFANENGL